MANFTKPIALTSGTFTNLFKRMQTAGYKGGGIVSILRIFNGDAAGLAFIHLTDDGTNPPATGTDGWPVGAGTGGAGPTFLSDRGANMVSVDLASTWIYSSASFNVTVMAVGA